MVTTACLVAAKDSDLPRRGAGTTSRLAWHHRDQLQATPLTKDLERSNLGHDVVLAVMVQPEFVHPGLPGKPFLVEHNGTRIGSPSIRVLNRRIAIPFFIVERDPFAHGRDLGDLFGLTGAKTVDSDPVLSRMARGRIPRDPDGLSDVEAVRGLGTGGGSGNRHVVAGSVQRTNVIGQAAARG